MFHCPWSREEIAAKDTLIVPVAGVQKMRTDLTKIQRGYEVELRPEPTNRHDRNAIQVVAWYGERPSRTGDVLGYIPREYAAKLDVSEWTATVGQVVEAWGQPAGLRLMLIRRVEDD
jgi:hypothetical protein